MLSLAVESVEGEKKRGGEKESLACFHPSTFVQMTGKQIRALKANSRQINLAESKRLHERDVGNFHPQPGCLGRTGRLQSVAQARLARSSLCIALFLLGRD